MHGLGFSPRAHSLTHIYTIIWPLAGHPRAHDTNMQNLHLTHGTGHRDYDETRDAQHVTPIEASNGISTVGAALSTHHQPQHLRMIRLVYTDEYDLQLLPAAKYKSAHLLAAALLLHTMPCPVSATCASSSCCPARCWRLGSLEPPSPPQGRTCRPRADECAPDPSRSARSGA